MVGWLEWDQRWRSLLPPMWEIMLYKAEGVGMERPGCRERFWGGGSARISWRVWAGPRGSVQGLCAHWERASLWIDTPPSSGTGAGHAHLSSVGLDEGVRGRSRGWHWRFRWYTWISLLGYYTCQERKSISLASSGFLVKFSSLLKDEIISKGKYSSSGALLLAEWAVWQTPGSSQAHIHTLSNLWQNSERLWENFVHIQTD